MDDERVDIMNIAYISDGKPVAAIYEINITQKQAINDINNFNSAFTRDWFVSETGKNDWKFLVRKDGYEKDHTRPRAAAGSRQDGS